MALAIDVADFYEGLDNATLLALLPELRHQIERVTFQLERLQAGQEQMQNADAVLGDTVGEALTALAGALGTDDPTFQHVRNTFAERWAEMAAADGYSPLMSDMFARLVDLSDREGWIVKNLGQRGLLPSD